MWLPLCESVATSLAIVTVRMVYTPWLSVILMTSTSNGRSSTTSTLAEPRGGQCVGVVFATRARVMGIVARAATSIGVSAAHPSANRCLVLIRMGGGSDSELGGAARHTHSRDCLRCGDG
jgi:hypothetical protein